MKEFIIVITLTIVFYLLHYFYPVLYQNLQFIFFSPLLAYIIYKIFQFIYSYVKSKR